MVPSDSASTTTTTQDPDPNPGSSSLIPKVITHYPRNSEDALAALNILKKWLPSELGLNILDHAEYWLLSRVYREDTLTYTSATGRDRIPYLESKPIQGSHFPVKKIVIDIWSHDQEFNYYFESGTDNYEDSPTWFEIGIQRPSGREDILRDLDAKIVDNVHGSAKTRHHRIVYCGLGGQPGGASVRWMRNLEAEDRVTVIPQARFLGWKNFVEAAAIGVYTDPL
ncbi:hypothetical protein N7456_010589 [Penicillium angulare]|uniref:Uncharacterized protein n=1 Tax=Penicillium angulare TaxID=116970 RepID=A0A9W9F6X2_9EURO|nr:hypothetical protein N7456_010589 [Penicillium angulare]